MGEPAAPAPEILKDGPALSGLAEVRATRVGGKWTLADPPVVVAEDIRIDIEIEGRSVSALAGGQVTSRFDQATTLALAEELAMKVNSGLDDAFQNSGETRMTELRARVFILGRASWLHAFVSAEGDLVLELAYSGGSHSRRYTAPVPPVRLVEDFNGRLHLLELSKAAVDGQVSCRRTRLADVVVPDLAQLLDGLIGNRGMLELLHLSGEVAALAAIRRDGAAQPPVGQ